MNRTLKKAISASLLIHALGVFFILWGIRKLPKVKNPPKQPIFIVTEEGPPGKGRTSIAKGSSQLKKGERQAKENRPFNFGLFPKPFGQNNSETGRGQGSEGGRGSPDGYDFANGLGVEQDGKAYPFFDALWRRVNAATLYPQDFVKQRIQGSVTVQLAVDRKGVFTGEIQSVRGPEPFLNTFVVATLVHSLREPLPEKLWFHLDQGKNDSLLLVFQFEFNLFGPGGSPKTEEYRHFKNILNFRRDSYTDPKLNQVIEKFFARYVPPVIILPGFFYIDFPRAYQFLNNQMTRPPDEDDLRSQRLEMNKEKWGSFIHRNSNRMEE